MRRQDDQPDYVRRWQPALIAVGFMPVVVFALLTVLELAGLVASDPRRSIIVLAVVAILGVAGGWGVWRWQVRIARRVRDTDYQSCLVCCYDMRSSSGVDRCPECGSAWNEAEAQRRWRAWCAPFLRRM